MVSSPAGRLAVTTNLSLPVYQLIRRARTARTLARNSATYSVRCESSAVRQ